MPTTTRAGDLRERVGFYRPLRTDDGYGNVEIGFAAVADFVVAAAVAPRLGGEAILAGRLAGRNYVNVTVRASAATRMVGAAWKARNERDGTDYNIRAIVDPYRATPMRGRFLEMLCEEGVAT